MKLSRRLLEIASMIPNNSVVADIGSDHGYLAKYLIENNIANQVYCVEVAKGPYSATLKTICDYNLENINVLLGNGLTPIKDIIDIEYVVIAGMGFNTIAQIIEDNFYYAKNRRFIIQSNNLHSDLRKFLVEHNLNILDEKIIYDDFYYQIMVVEYNDIRQELSELEIDYGPILIKNKNKVFVDYLNHLLKAKQKILELIELTSPKYWIISQEIKDIKEILEK